MGGEVSVEMSNEELRDAIIDLFASHRGSQAEFIGILEFIKAEILLGHTRQEDE